MKHSVRYTSLSHRDLEAIVEYYLTVRPKTALRYLNGIQKSVKKLEQFPSIGRIVPEFEEEFLYKYREIIYEQFRIIYRTEETCIYILRIFDSRRLLSVEAISPS
jgi:toxin ParE1/3/4